MFLGDAFAETSLDAENEDEMNGELMAKEDANDVDENENNQDEDEDENENEISKDEESRDANPLSLRFCFGIRRTCEFFFIT